MSPAQIDFGVKNYLAQTQTQKIFYPVFSR